MHKIKKKAEQIACELALTLLLQYNWIFNILEKNYYWMIELFFILSLLCELSIEMKWNEMKWNEMKWNEW
jgi:hypothetical protein